MFGKGAVLVLCVSHVSRQDSPSPGVQACHAVEWSRFSSGIVKSLAVFVLMGCAMKLQRWILLLRFPSQELKHKTNWIKGRGRTVAICRADENAKWMQAMEGKDTSKKWEVKSVICLREAWAAEQ